MTVHQIDEQAESDAFGLLWGDPKWLGQLQEAFASNPFSDEVFREAYETLVADENKSYNSSLEPFLRRRRSDGLLSKWGGANKIISAEMQARGLDPDWVLERLSTNNAILRIREIQEKGARALASSIPLCDSLNDLQETISAAMPPKSQVPMKDLEEVASEFYGEQSYTDWVKSNIEANRRGEIPLVGDPSGLKEIDRTIGGIVPGTLTVLGARPSMGKSEYLLHVVAKAVAAGIPTVFYSLEMSTREVFERLVGIEAGVHYSYIRRGDVSDYDLGQVERAQSEVSSRSENLVIRSGRDYTPNQLSVDAKKLKKERGIKLVVVDHLVILASENQRWSRYEATTHASRTMKMLSLSENLAVWAACQLNREVAKVGSHKPNMSHLRDSGSIEQDADVILLIHRPDYYDALDKPGEVHLIADKNRNGPRDTIKYRFTYEKQKYEVLGPFGSREDTQQIDERAFDGFVPD